jgi:hypothetical protein
MSYEAWGDGDEFDSSCRNCEDTYSDLCAMETALEHARADAIRFSRIAMAFAAVAIVEALVILFLN